MTDDKATTVLLGVVGVLDMRTNEHRIYLANVASDNTDASMVLVGTGDTADHALQDALDSIDKASDVIERRLAEARAEMQVQ